MEESNDQTKKLLETNDMSPDYVPKIEEEEDEDKNSDKKQPEITDEEKKMFNSTVQRETQIDSNNTSAH